MFSKILQVAPIALTGFNFYGQMENFVCMSKKIFLFQGN